MEHLLEMLSKLPKELNKNIKDQIFVFAGKWEDGINEKVLGDPLANYDAKEIIKRIKLMQGLTVLIYLLQVLDMVLV